MLELCNLGEKVFNTGNQLFYRTTYEIKLSLLAKNQFEDLWKKVYDGNEETLSLLEKVGVIITVYNPKKTQYVIRGLYDLNRYKDYLEAAEDLNKIRIEGDHLEQKKCLKKKWSNRTGMYAATLGENIYQDILNFIRDKVVDAFKVDFKIEKSSYDSTTQNEFITAKLGNLTLLVDYHFQSSDIDLEGQYLGNKIYTVGFKCWEGDQLIEDYLNASDNYERSSNKLQDFIERKTYLSADIIGSKIISSLNQRVFTDTQDYLKNHSNLTCYIFNSFSKDSHVKIVANWKNTKLDELIKIYNQDFVKKMPLGKFLREKGLVSELNLLVEKDHYKIVQLRVEDDSDPKILEAIKSIRLTKDFYTEFVAKLSHYFDITFADKVIDLPESISKMLDDLKATPFQKKLFADEINKVYNNSSGTEDSDDDDFDELPNYSCDSGPGGYSPYD